MEAIRFHQVVKKDGELLVTDLPCKRGEAVEVIILPASDTRTPRFPRTARQLCDSELVGLWKDRQEVGESSVFARQLREEASQRPFHSGSRFSANARGPSI